MMKRSRRGCFVVGGMVMLLILFLGAGLWFFLFSNAETADAPPPPTMYVFLLSPASGDEVDVGDYVPVTLHAVGEKPFVGAELFVNGQSLGMVKDSPESASWIWQPSSAGIYSLIAHATDTTGEVGQSQAVIVTVLAGNSVKQVYAEEGQTLEQIGAGFGAPPQKMAEANPLVDPFEPLPDGYPVQVPTSGGDAGNGSGQGDAPTDESIPNLIHWQFQSTEPVDKSYCYISFGDGVWQKIPKKPFAFFSGGQANYPQHDIKLSGGKGLIQAQCWGWLEGALKYLGQGEMQFDTQPLPEQWVLIGSGFQLVGLPQLKPLSGDGGMGGNLTIPPPFALREPASKAECHQQHGLGAWFLCELLESQVKSNYILVWEWQPPVCWPGTCITKIDGYRIYEIEYTKSVKLLKDVNHPSQKVAVVPIGWASCFGVRAYVNDPAIEDSEMATWCPGQSSQAKMNTYQPANVLTVADYWIWYDDDCGGVAKLWPVPGANESMVGAIQVSTDDCGAQYRGTIGVKFPTPSLPQEAVLQKATLRFSMHDLSYGVYYGDNKWLATNVNWMCPTILGSAKVDWTGWGGGDNFAFAPPHLNIPASVDPFMTLSTFHDGQVDVTPIVSNWMKPSQSNQGFVLAFDWDRIYDYHFDYGAIIQECFAYLSGLELDVFYFAP